MNLDKTKEKNDGKEEPEENPAVTDTKYAPNVVFEKSGKKFFRKERRGNLSDVWKKAKQGKGKGSIRRVSPRQGLRN
jgi:hypothetical protein